MPKEVGKVGTQSADYLKPVSERKGNIASFFAKQQQQQDAKVKGENSPEQPSQAAKTKVKETSASPSREHGPVKPKEEQVTSRQSMARTDYKTQLNKIDAEQPPDALEKDLPLNPDEGDEIASTSNSQAINTALEVEDNNSKEGAQGNNPIILDDEMSNKAETAKRTRSRSLSGEDARSGRKKSKAQASTHTPSKRTLRAGTAHKAKSETSEIDQEGNKKLTQYFEITDD